MALHGRGHRCPGAGPTLRRGQTVRVPDTSERVPAASRPPAPDDAAARAARAEVGPADHRAWLANWLPVAGRVHRGSARVRLGDARPGRRGRFDALARLLQDVAEDDAVDADLGDEVGWILRRTAMLVERFPVLGERLDLATFCSGTGSRWAERTTLVTGEAGARVATRAVWVAVDRRSGSPARLDDRFHQVYGPSAGDRRVRLRLALPAPPGDVDGAAGRPWPLRAADLDVWGHANNAIAWSAVEDGLEERPATPLAAAVEHPAALLPDAAPRLVVADDGPARHVWLVGGEDGRVLVAARLGPPEHVPLPTGR